MGYILYHLLAKKPEDWSEQIEEIHIGANTEQRWPSIVLYLTFHVKRAMTALCICYSDYLINTYGAVLILLFCVLTFITTLRPRLFESKYKQIICILLEFYLVFLTGILFLINFFFQEKYDTALLLGVGVILCFSVVSLLTTVFTLIETVTNIINWCKDAKEKRVKNRNLDNLSNERELRKEDKKDERDGFDFEGDEEQGESELNE